MLDDWLFILEISITFIFKALHGPEMYPESFMISFSSSKAWRELETSSPKPLVKSGNGEEAECVQKSSSSLHVDLKNITKTNKKKMKFVILWGRYLSASTTLKEIFGRTSASRCTHFLIDCSTLLGLPIQRWNSSVNPKFSNRAIVS